MPQSRPGRTTVKIKRHPEVRDWAVVVCRYANGRIDGALCTFTPKQADALDRHKPGKLPSPAYQEAWDAALAALGWKDGRMPPLSYEYPLPADMWGVTFAA